MSKQEKLEAVILSFVERPDWSADADPPEDSAEWRAGYEAAQSNLREALKPWWAFGGPLRLTPHTGGEDRLTALALGARPGDVRGQAMVEAAALIASLRGALERIAAEADTPRKFWSARIGEIARAALASLSGANSSAEPSSQAGDA